MTSDIQEKIDKLPKWAQEYIATLQNRVTVLQQLRDASLLEVKETQAYLEYNGDRTYLPDRAYFTFLIAGGKIKTYIAIDGTLRIYGNATIKIIPQALNSINIGIDE